MLAGSFYRRTGGDQVIRQGAEILPLTGLNSIEVREHRGDFRNAGTLRLDRGGFNGGGIEGCINHGFESLRNSQGAKPGGDPQRSGDFVNQAKRQGFLSVEPVVFTVSKQGADFGGGAAGFAGVNLDHGFRHTIQSGGVFSQRRGIPANGDRGAVQHQQRVFRHDDFAPGHCDQGCGGCGNALNKDRDSSTMRL